MAEPNSSPTDSTAERPTAIKQPSTEPAATAPSTAPRAPRQRQLPFHQIHKQPAPIRVFPFPTFTASNPISLVHLAVAWISQVFSPPPSEPSVIHTAHWDDDTRSIIVIDEKSIQDLWQQGFYGKGSLSRSEPNWLKREKIRRGALEGIVSEANTDKRREERMRTKWERARLEQEAIEQKRLEEARALAAAEAEVAAVSSPSVPAALAPLPPVGPLELLALPNSNADLASCLHNHAKSLASSMDGTEVSVEGSNSSGNDEVDSSTTLSDTAEVKHRKSVRFSPDVQSTTFQHTDPPTPPCLLSSTSLKADAFIQPNGAGPVVGAESVAPTAKVSSPDATAEAVIEKALVNKEHLQLAPEEAFFLAFALGALKVVDNTTRDTLSTKDLLSLLRQNSYLPPRSLEQLQPDDPFLIHYSVYHHFRSLGWVPRPGIKFGVDWLLYMRGPVFDHAEYGLLVLPSYVDPEWKADGRQLPRKSWHWLMGVNRVLSKVFKSLVIIYVEIPPPNVFSEEHGPIDLVDVLKRYKIREVMVKRWSGNRNR